MHADNGGSKPAMAWISYSAWGGPKRATVSFSEYRRVYAEVRTSIMVAWGLHCWWPSGRCTCHLVGHLHALIVTARPLCIVPLNPFLHLIWPFRLSMACAAVCGGAPAGHRCPRPGARRCSGQERPQPCLQPGARKHPLRPAQRALQGEEQASRGHVQARCCCAPPV